MEAVHVIVKVITPPEGFGTKLALERCRATYAVNRPTVATSFAQIRKRFAAYLTLVSR